MQISLQPFIYYALRTDIVLLEKNTQTMILNA